MAAGVTIKCKRKAGAFANGELAAGEWGLDVTNSIWYYSINGTTVVAMSTGSGTVDTANSPNANEFARFTDANTIEGRTASEVKADLDLEIGTDIQAYDADLAAIAALTSAANKIIRFTGSGTADLLDFKDEDNMSSNSDTAIPSQQSVKAYVDAAVTGLLDFKGATDTSANPNYPAASKGDIYVVSVAGKIGGASGKSVDVGDMYLATADNAGGTEASVGTSWVVLEHNLVGAYFAGGTDVPVTDGGTGASTASGARTNLGLAIGSDVAAFSHNHAASEITSGDLATARMQTNLKAALEAVSQTFNSTNTTIDGGTL